MRNEVRGMYKATGRENLATAKRTNYAWLKDLQGGNNT